MQVYVSKASTRWLRRHMSYKIVTLPGDGVGPEVTEETLKVLSATSISMDTEEHLIGGVAIDKVGEPFPKEAEEACKNSDAILLGAVGGPKWDNVEPSRRPEQGLLKLRKELDLFANLRPVRFFDALLEHSPLRSDLCEGVDMLFVRELVGGIYFGPRSERSENSEGVQEAWDTMIYSDPEVERIVRVAANAARERQGRVLSVDKANVLASSRLWREVATRVVSQEYDDVELKHGLVDSVAMDIIKRPRQFDVVVTKNMFGDILTDLASVLAGSLGLLPSASLSVQGKPGVYEPIHGSAPDIAGQGVVNPIAAVLSGSMMLRHNLGLSREADAIEEAVECALADGLRTPDLVIPGTPKSETCTTKDMGDAIATHTKRILSSNKQSVRAFSSASASSQQREKPLTMFDKIWRDHVVHRQDDGTCLMYVDRHLVHEVTSPQAFEGLERAGLEVRCVDRTLVTADHNVPTTKRERSGGVQAIEDEESRVQVATLEKNVKKFGLKYFGLDDTRQGIVHIVGPEQGFTLPGMTLVCGDSHTATHGAFGALAFGIGTTEVEHVLATQTILQKPAKNMRVTVRGERLPLGVVSKDLALHLCGAIGTGGGTGHVIEYAGKPIEQLSMEARMSICNMAIEAGARAGMIAPDEITYRYLKGRPMAPKGDTWERAVKYWSQLPSDEGATYDTEIEIDADSIAPQVTWGTSPEDVVAVNSVVPSFENIPEEERAQLRRKLEYMGLEEGQSIEDIKIDKVFIGSCTNGRIEDLREVAETVQGQQVSDNVHAMVVPGSGLVKRQAEEEGIADVLKEAGFDWREPGCSMCLGMNADKLKPGERCASTSNRNFEGRQGPGGRTHLMSPAMAAAAALKGRITDVREIGRRRFSSVPASSTSSSSSNDTGFKTVHSTAAPLDIDNVDTDMIIPARYLKTVSRSGLAEGLFANLRKDDDDFVLDRPQYKDASILVAGDNFGCGSSREHAPWSLYEAGLRCVISTSFANIFENNCFKNGLLPVRVDEEQHAVLLKDAQDGATIRVDLENCTVHRENGDVISFDVDEFKRYCLLNGLNEVTMTLEKSDMIDSFEKKMKEERPWL